MSWFDQFNAQQTPWNGQVQTTGPQGMRTMTPEQEAAIRESLAKGGRAPGTPNVVQPVNAPGYLPMGQAMPQGGQAPNQASMPNPASMPNTGGMQQWDQQRFIAQFGSPKTPQELEAMEAQLNAAGITIARNAKGIAGKIKLPNGMIVDVIKSAGMGGQGFQWLIGNGPNGTGLGSVGQGGFGDYVTPFGENFAARDPNQIAGDPAYRFQMEQGMKAIQGSAAARGTLLTGGTLKALDRFGQGLAATYDTKFYDRDMNEYLLRRDNFERNQDRPFNKNTTLAGLGKPS